MGLDMSDMCEEECEIKCRRRRTGLTVKQNEGL